MKDVIREYDVIDRAITDTRDTTVSTVYDETIIDDRKTVRDDRTTVEETVIIDETRPRHGGPRKPEKTVIKEQCICEICTCGCVKCIFFISFIYSLFFVKVIIITLFEYGDVDFVT